MLTLLGLDFAQSMSVLDTREEFLQYMDEFRKFLILVRQSSVNIREILKLIAYNLAIFIFSFPTDEEHMIYTSLMCSFVCLMQNNNGLTEYPHILAALNTRTEPQFIELVWSVR